jgi:hypothetical protein
MSNLKQAIADLLAEASTGWVPIARFNKTISVILDEIAAIKKLYNGQLTQASKDSIIAYINEASKGWVLTATFNKNSIVLNDAVSSLKKQVDILQEQVTAWSLSNSPTYGEIYGDSSFITSIPADDSYIKLNIFNQVGLNKNITIDSNNSQIVLNKPGKYKLDFTIDNILADSDITFTLSIFVNGNSIPSLTHIMKSNSPDSTLSSYLNGFFTGSEGDEIDVRMKQDGVTPVNITTIYPNLNVVFIEN